MATTYFWQDELAAGQVRLGLTQEAQEALGKIKFVDLPEIGTSLTVGKPFLSVEAEKAVLDLEAPLAGTVVDVQSCCDFSQRKKSSRVNDNDSAAFDFWKRLLTLP